MERSRRRGVATRLREFWAGPWWWIVPLALLVVPTLVVLLVAHAGSEPAPFTYTAF
jgi:hypothetical protein